MQVTQLRQSIISFLLLTGIFLTSCKTYSEEDKSTFDKRIENYISAKKWEMKKSSSGLYTQVLNAGDTTLEKIKYTSEVTLKYKGKLLNGTTVDQTRPGEPLVTQLNGLIGGFQEGLQDLHKGAKVRLIIPPHLGYGNEDKGKIPASSILVFEVEVEEVR